MLKILDICCCSGGASVGMYQAAEKYHIPVEITGLDIETQLRYPFNRKTMDLQDLTRIYLEQFDFIWASPPCQRYSIAVHPKNRHKYPDLVSITRDLLISSGLPCVIENVVKAPIRHDLMLCGEMFGLKVFKHRYFEIEGFSVPQPYHSEHEGSVKYGDYVTTAGRGCDGSGKIVDWQEALGIDWERDKKKLAEAVPPAYSEYIFTQYMQAAGIIQILPVDTRLTSG
jgi:DNA (cytosine-5)-methyltransferase 1